MKVKLGHIIEPRNTTTGLTCEFCREQFKKGFVIKEVPMSFNIEYKPKSIYACPHCAKTRFPKYFRATKRAKKDRSAPLFEGI